MSAAGISTNLATHYPTQYNPSTPPHNNLSFHQDLGQLGDDLQEGNLSAAQQDFAALQLDGPQSTIANPNSSASTGSSSTTATESNNPVTQAFNQLAVDLQNGNLSAAQQDYTSIQQNFQNRIQSQSGEPRFDHEHQTGGVNELFDQLGQQLQSSNLSTAQQTYSSLLPNAAFAQLQPVPGSGGVSISV